MAKGKSQGYLTYDEVTDYLPDEAVDPEKIDQLLSILDETEHRSPGRSAGARVFRRHGGKGKTAKPVSADKNKTKSGAVRKATKASGLPIPAI